MIIPENASELRIDTDSDHPMHVFCEIAQRTASVVAAEFKRVRSDAPKIVPPVLIYTDAYMSGVASTAVIDYYRDRFGKFCYNPVDNTICASAERIEELLAKEEGKRQLALIMAEENIHAQSTKKIGKDIRVGFAAFRQRRQPHGLEPGAVYDATSVTSSDAVVDTTSAEAQTTRLILTERVTQVVIYGMIEKLLPNDLYDYPFLTLSNGIEPMTFAGKDQLLLEAIQSLSEGNDYAMRHPESNQRLLRILNTPESVGPVSIKVAPKFKAPDDICLGRSI